MSNDKPVSGRTQQPDPLESETVAKLRSLLQGLESESILGNHNAASRKQRLLKMREEITWIARNQARSVCRCKEITVVDSWDDLEKFEADLNDPCPIHGPCRHSIMVAVTGYLSDGDPRDRRLDELLQRYHRRCVTLPEFGG
jgi:hypothetical protein